MRIGRFAFGISKGFTAWGFIPSSCGCKLLDLGKLYFEWTSKDCKCNACKKYTCECPNE